MDFKKLQKHIAEKVKLIAVSPKSLANARELSGDFLITSAVVTTALKDLEVEMAKLKTVQEASFADAMGEAGGKTVTEKKTMAVTDSMYVEAREALEESDAYRSWLKTYIRIFENASILYRQFCRIE